MDDLSTLEPRLLWRLFFELCAIPRPSHAEAAAGAWALEQAQALGLRARADAAGNVAIGVPASAGLESAPGLILQAHLDMVPQKLPGMVHDFSRDPILPLLDPADPAWLRATGTTLGADNGIGVAAAFALAGDPDLRHGPLELLLTVNEEDGMSGARAVEPGLVSGSLLLNLDGESEEELCVACAGGSRLAFRFDEATGLLDPSWDLVELELGGLKGGHSGADIQLGRANAIKVLVDALAASAGEVRLVAIGGGSLPNAIAREARATLALPRSAVAAWLAGLRVRLEAAATAYAQVEPDFAFRLDVRPAGAGEAALAARDSQRVLSALSLAPDGLQLMLSGEVARLSSNMGALSSSRPTSGALRVEGRVLVRGAYDPEKLDLVERFAQAIQSGRGTVEYQSITPAWPPNPASALLATARAIWTRRYGRPPAERATHGGLECGLFRAKFPGWDMLSVGPSIRNPHSPDEAVQVASVGRFYGALRALVEALAASP